MKKYYFLLFWCLCFSNVVNAQDEETRISNVRFVLNSGAKVARSQIIPIHIEALGARKMMLSNQKDFTGATWEEFSHDVGQWTLANGEGEKTVYLKLQDKFGNASEVYEASIGLDKTPPQKPKIHLVAEHGFSQNPEKRIKVELVAEEAKYMMVSNNKEFSGARWQTYRPTSEWRLEGELDGLRRVYVKLSDAARNESETAVGDIVIDSQPPVDAKVFINNNQLCTTEKDGKVQITLFARGATQMVVSNNVQFENAEWKPYSPTPIGWQLQGQQGEHTLFARFRDQANNETDIVSDKIVWDSEPPQECSLTINDGAKYAENPDKMVKLKIHAKGAKLMMLSSNKDFTGARWEAFVAHATWKLIGDNGAKTIYIKFKDENGNESEFISASIVLAL